MNTHLSAFKNTLNQACKWAAGSADKRRQSSPGNQPLPLRLCDGKTALTRFRPNKMHQMQAAMTQPHAITTPQQDFDRLTDALRNAKADPVQGCCPKVC